MKVLNRREIVLSASVSCFDLYNIESQMKQVEDAGIKLLHFDVVDGRFNDCFILGTPTLEAIRHHTKLPIEVHLGVMEPLKYITQFASAGADYIAVHYETMKGPDAAKRIFESIRQAGARPLIALKAETGMDRNLSSILSEADWIIKLLVEPGYSGQRLKDDALKKMREVKDEIIKQGIDTGLEADGNVNELTIPQIVKAGADILTGGSSGLFNGGSTITQNAKKMVEMANATDKNRRGWPRREGMRRETRA